MPVTAVEITSVIPTDVNAEVAWAGDDVAVSSATAIIALTQQDLDDPARRLTANGTLPADTFSVPVLDVDTGLGRLASGHDFWLQCEMDGVFSEPQVFTTTQTGFYTPTGLVCTHVSLGDEP